MLTQNPQGYEASIFVINPEHWINPLEMIAFGIVLSRQSKQMGTRVARITHFTTSDTVEISTYNLFGMEKRVPTVYPVSELRFTTDSTSSGGLLEHVARSQEYFVLYHHDAKLRRLFSEYETF